MHFFIFNEFKTCFFRTACLWLPPPFCPLQLQLQCYSPSLKGQETDSHRYGIFGQPPSKMSAATSSHCENKENMPEVSDDVIDSLATAELM